MIRKLPDAKLTAKTPEDFTGVGKDSPFFV
jgi:hypothetical protein